MVSHGPEGRTVFRFYRPNARQVALAGEFNAWDESFLMSGARDGWWEASLELAPGSYEFRYHVDGQWYTDYAAFGVTRTATGWNSVVHVEEPAIAGLRRSRPRRLPPAGSSRRHGVSHEPAEPMVPDPAAESRLVEELDRRLLAELDAPPPGSMLAGRIARKRPSAPAPLDA